MGELGEVLFLQSILVKDPSKDVMLKVKDFNGLIKYSKFPQKMTFQDGLEPLQKITL